MKHEGLWHINKGDESFDFKLDENVTSSKNSSIKFSVSSNKPFLWAMVMKFKAKRGLNKTGIVYYSFYWMLSWFDF